MFLVFDETHHYRFYSYFEQRAIISNSESLGIFILAIYRPISLHNVLSKLLKITVAVASADF